MPLELIRNDITALRVDAVVNAANSRLQRGGGVCGAIFARADGNRLQEACDRIGFCPPGEAVLTPSFGLPAPYVIHTVGPVWQGGTHREEELLRSCYRRSLDVAREHGLHSVAFPLISSGIFGYPRREALSAAVSAIGDWLMSADTDMNVFLVLFDRASFDLGNQLHARVRSFIDEHYAEKHTSFFRNRQTEIERQLSDMQPSAPACAEPFMDGHADSADFAGDAPAVYGDADGDADGAPDAAPVSCAPPAYSEQAAAPAGRRRSLADVLRQSEESFSQMLFRLIDEAGLTDPEVYKRANLDRKLFSKIRSNPQYQPAKGTVLALCIALHLNIDQSTDLLRRAGYALSPSSKSDLIVEYFIREKIYSIHELNETLFAFEQKLLGAQAG